MLEIVARLTDKQPGDTGFTQVQAPGGKTLLLLVCSFIAAEPKVTGCADSIWRGGVCESIDLSVGCLGFPPRWPLLAFIYGEARSQVPIRVGYKLYSNSSLALQGSEGVMGLGHPKIFMGQRISAVGLPWAGPGMLKSRTRRV